jgi:hypothetical protein
LCSRSIDRFLRSDPQKSLIKVNMGVRAFEKIKVNYHDDEIFRVTQEGAECLFSLISENRKLPISLKDLIYLVHNNTIKFAEIPEEYTTLLAFDKISPGFYIIHTIDTDIDKEIMVVQVFTTSVCLMTDKDRCQSILIKHFDRL